MNIQQTAQRIRNLNAKAARLIEEADSLRAYLRNSLGLGSHDGATIYKVNPTRVKAHTRRGYTALRCR